jgi:sugar/nucleoside kinase (ribokinase family)
MRERPSALSAGYMPLDVIDDALPVRRRAGGTAGNVASILAFLGWDSALAGRVGDDSAGEQLLGDLGHAGVDCTLIDREPGALTNRLVHRIADGSHRYLFTCPHCSQKLPRSRPLTLERLAGVLSARQRPRVYFFDRANPATVALAEHYASLGTLVVYEPSTPASAGLLQRAIAAAAIVKGSVEHGPGLVASYDGGPARQIRVITHGGEGARFRIGRSAWHSVGVFDVPLVDASGAGDWTTAGMLHLLAGIERPGEGELSAAIRLGHSFAALNCAVSGARGLMEGRSRASVLAMATRVRGGERRLPTVRVQAPSRAPDGACPWCLLPLAQTLAQRATS